jgi:hypothetical protein
MESWPCWKSSNYVNLWKSVFLKISPRMPRVSNNLEMSRSFSICLAQSQSRLAVSCASLLAAFFTTPLARNTASEHKGPSVLRDIVADVVVLHDDLVQVGPADGRVASVGSLQRITISEGQMLVILENQLKWKFGETTRKRSVGSTQILIMIGAVGSGAIGGRVRR